LLWHADLHAAIVRGPCLGSWLARSGLGKIEVIILVWETRDASNCVFCLCTVTKIHRGRIVSLSAPLHVLQ
jgi:hypothetical protein